MSVYELAQKYYPRLWDKSRLEALVQAERLTQAEMNEITGDEEV
jgi:hypothetical protein